MNITSRLVGVAVTVVAAGVISAPADAATIITHCPDPEGTKVETSGTVTVSTGLQPGTEVCYKAATQIGTAVVDEDGDITSTITPTRNAAKLIPNLPAIIGLAGISYYIAPGDEECEYGNCEGTS